MASRSQPPVTSFVPSEAWLACAACGPVSESLLQQVGLSLREETGLLFRHRCHVVEKPVPFPTLCRWVSERPAVRETIERIESLRSRGGVKKRPLTHEEMAGSARAALLLGKGKLFMQHYKAYVQERPYVWHPDPQHFLFWDCVLGPGWAGAEAVPEGEARREVMLFSSCAFAFFATPAHSARGAGLCGAPAGHEWLEIAAALRAADAEAMQNYLVEGSLAARAACKLLTGMWEEARSGFERLFGRSEDNRYGLVQRHGLPLLTYAIICGVLSGGSTRFLRSWFDAARYAVQYVFSWSMEKEQAEMMRFYDHLELVDSLINRGAVAQEAPRFNGSLSRLPFAMAYAALPNSVRKHLGEEADMVEALEHLSQAGLTLLSHYGAGGMLQADALAPSLRGRAEALLKGVDTSRLPRLRKPAPVRALVALRDYVHQSTQRCSSLLGGRADFSTVLLASRMSEATIVHLGNWVRAMPPGAPPVLRCMRKHATGELLVLEGAPPTEITRLLTALYPEVDVVGSLALRGECPSKALPQPVLLLAHLSGDRCLASLRLRLLPGTTPLMVPAHGLEVPVLEGEGGEAITVQRALESEWKQALKVTRLLEEAGLRDAGCLLDGALPVMGFAALSEMLGLCRRFGLEACWEKGRALRLLQPQGHLELQVGAGEGDWLELGGSLLVDEGRVLELSTLLEAYAFPHESNALCLGVGEYVQLTPALERQLSLLELVHQEKNGSLGVPPSAVPLLRAQVESVVPAPEPVQAFTIPSSLQVSLRPYQKEGFRWLAERAAMGMGALLADDMGLGKTVQLLALLLHAAEQQGARPALVVAPVSLLGNWAEEAARFAPALRPLIYTPQHPECLKGLEADALVLASYGQIASRLQLFAAQEWGVLVLDEAQAIKNPDAQRSRAICTLRARARFCLTGTPIENSLLDLWSQMRFLNPGLLGARSAFLKRFKKPQDGQLELLRQQLAPLVLRRTKAEVLAQLPPLTENTEWVEFSREERALYESLRRSAVAKLGQEGGQSGGISILAELTRLRRACCHGRLAFAGFAGSSAKLVAMAERVKELRAAGRRALIFSQFTDVLNLAQEVLLAQGSICLRLDGSTPAKQRSKLVNHFQQGRADAFLISLKAGGTGLNLTAADYVILLDPWWNPSVEAQAAGRSHRLGQQQPVTLCRFVVRGTVEERILALHKEKRQLADSILNGHAEGVSLSALRELLGKGD